MLNPLTSNYQRILHWLNLIIFDPAFANSCERRLSDLVCRECCRLYTVTGKNVNKTSSGESSLTEIGVCEIKDKEIETSAECFDNC